jgi:hypothetical protein
MEATAISYFLVFDGWRMHKFLRREIYLFQLDRDN